MKKSLLILIMLISPLLIACGSETQEEIDADTPAPKAEEAQEASPDITESNTLLELDIDNALLELDTVE